MSGWEMAALILSTIGLTLSLFTLFHSITTGDFE